MTQETIKDSNTGSSVGASYEVMLILNPELRESEIKKKLKEIVETVEKAGGKITNEDFWGKRAMAYKISNQEDGVYMVYNMELPASLISEVKDLLRLEKEVLRYLILRIPEGYEYTKYDLEAEKEAPKLKKEKPEKTSHKKSLVAPDIKHESSARAKEKIENKGKEADETELDNKLDAILEGEDLNL